MAEITTEGRRVYIKTQYGEACVPRLKALGAKWDADSKRWWVGAAKLEAVRQAITESATEEPAQEDASDIRLVGKCKYKGRTYYARFIGETKKGYSCRLISLDQKVDFWAACAQPGEVCDGNGEIALVLKFYAPRAYRGRTEYTTLGLIQRFLEKAKQDEQAKKDGTAATKNCWECGRDFTELDAKRNGGDWNDSYCGC